MTGLTSSVCHQASHSPSFSLEEGLATGSGRLQQEKESRVAFSLPAAAATCAAPLLSERVSSHSVLQMILRDKVILKLKPVIMGHLQAQEGEIKRLLRAYQMPETSIQNNLNYIKTKALSDTVETQLKEVVEGLSSSDHKVILRVLRRFKSGTKEGLALQETQEGRYVETVIQHLIDEMPISQAFDRFLQALPKKPPSIRLSESPPQYP